MVLFYLIHFLSFVFFVLSYFRDVLSVFLLQVQELEVQYSSVLSEINTIRKVIAQDNHELISKGVKGINSVAELFSKFEV